MEMLTHPKPQLLVLLFVLPPGSNESTPHQKAGGPVRVPSLLRHAGDARRPTARDGQAERPDTSPLSSLCYAANRREFFHATPFFVYSRSYHHHRHLKKCLPSPWCTPRLPSPDDFSLDEALCALAERATFFLPDLKRFLPA